MTLLRKGKTAFCLHIVRLRCMTRFHVQSALTPRVQNSLLLQGWGGSFGSQETSTSISLAECSGALLLLPLWPQLLPCEYGGPGFPQSPLKPCESLLLCSGYKESTGPLRWLSLTPHWQGVGGWDTSAQPGKGRNLSCFPMSPLLTQVRVGPYRFFCGVWLYCLVVIS